MQRQIKKEKDELEHKLALQGLGQWNGIKK